MMPAPFEELLLLDAGRLSAFRARWGKELGDCHAVAGDLFRGLIEAGSPFTGSVDGGDTLPVRRS